MLADLNAPLLRKIDEELDTLSDLSDLIESSVDPEAPMTVK